MLCIKPNLLLIFSVLILLSCNNSKEHKVTSKEILYSYHSNKKASYFSLPPGIVSVFLDDSKKGNPELKSLLGDINSLTFLIFNKDSIINKDCKYYKEISMRLDSINFFDLAQLNNGKELIKVKFEGDSNNFNELFFLISNYKSLYCISLQGNIDPNKVAQLIKPENISAVSNLDRFDRKK